MDFCTILPSPLGPLYATGREDALTGLYFDTQPHPPGIRKDDLPVFHHAAVWLDAYFRGDAPSPDALPLQPAGTDFQRLVWEILLTIPYGETMTYGQIAREAALRLGKPRMSAQAVGQAVGKNPLSIIIPCHRCIGSTGKLTGYAGGLENKIWLLGHEARQKEETK